MGRENVDNHEVTCVSLCSGYEGIGLALRRIIPNLRTILYSEIEKYACEVLVQRMEEGKIDVAPIWTNLKTLPCEQFFGKVDILTGGYPCQPFSAAGQRKGKDDPRHLWPWIREIIKGVRPGVCFFENVEGHISLGLREVLADLVKLGYRVENDCGEPTWGLFSAAEVGAPHQRKRVFILAYSKQPRPWECLAYGANGNGKFKPVRGENKISITQGCKNELADSGLFRPKEQEQQTARIEQPCQKLANPRSSKFNRIPEPEERWKNREVGNSGVKFGDTTGNNQRRVSITAMHRERLKAGGSGVGLWPARPGKPQYEWEEPRVLDGKLNSRWVSQLMNIPVGWVEIDLTLNPTLGNVDLTQEKYYGRCKKILRLLSETITEKKIREEVGRSFYFFAEEILRQDLFLQRDIERRCWDISTQETSREIPWDQMRELRYKENVGRSPYGFRHNKQRQRQFEDFLFKMPHEMALGSWENYAEKIKANLFCLWERLQDTCWNVCNPLSETKEIWESASNEKTYQWFMGCCKRHINWEKSQQATANRIDELRLLGNGVVPDTAEKAWITLMNRIINPNKAYIQPSVQLELF